MNQIDTLALRNAVDLALSGRESATLSGISSVIRILVPSQADARIELEDVQRAGFPVEIPQHGPGRVLADPSDRPRFRPERDEAIRIAYRYALEGTKEAPKPDWADWTRFSNAIQMFDRAADPSVKVRHPGKKIRTAIDRHPLWKVVEHTPVAEVVSWQRNKLDAEGRPVTWDSDLDDDIPVMEACGPDDERAIKFVSTRRGQTEIFIRPTGTDEWPRQMEVALPSGARRPIGPTATLVGALLTIQRFVNAVVEDGTQVRVWREPDGVEDFVAVYHAEGDTWRLAGGGDLPRTHYDMDDGYTLVAA